MPKKKTIETKAWPCSRAEAVALGAPYYDNGVVCKKGHGSIRHVGGSCVECARERSNAWRVSPAGKQKKREHRENNRATYNAYAVKYYHRDPEAARKKVREWQLANHEQHKRRQREWQNARYRDNPEKILASVKAYRDANREKCNERAREWKKANPDKVRKYVLVRKHRKRASEGVFTAEDIARITKMQKGKCAFCGKKRKLTIDHIVPISKGGTNWPANIQMLCGQCNCKKHVKDPLIFAQEMGRLL